MTGDVAAPKALVTGASKGIGRAIAAALRGAGYQVIGTSRRPESIPEKLTGIDYLRLDLLDDGSIEECVKKAGSIDILINNAGGSQFWPAAEAPLEKVKELFQLNLFGLVSLTQGFLSGMIERRSGYILNIGSLAGRFGLPFQSAYSASKFALAGFSWSLRNEVKKFGIHIVMLEPGHIRTSITPDVYLAPDSAFKGDMARTLQARDRNMAKGADPAGVAKKALKILKMKNPAPFYAVGGTAPLVVFLKRFMSDRFIEKQIKKNAGL